MFVLKFVFCLYFLAFIQFSYSKQVKWCTCDELEKCHDEHNDGVYDCADKCRSEYGFTFDTDAVFGCLRAERKNPNNCRAQIRKQMCASKPGQTIDESEVLTPKEKNKTKHGESLLSKFSNIDVGDDTNVLQYMKCVRDCSRKYGSDDYCYTQLDCRFKIIPDKEEQLHRCINLNDKLKRDMCNCLTVAAAPELCEGLEEKYGGIAGFG
uniref:Uncharacterized protein n=1 Tax=Acrobeloides nanus TaxID=290746 RepID=A0A914E324_9BILA